MNKRNTTLAIIVLALLVVLLIGKSCVFRNCTSTVSQTDWIETTDEAVCKKDFKPSMLIDSTQVANCNYPVVFHYKKPKFFNSTLAMNHIVGMTMHSLDSCPPMPDSTQAIHVYVSTTRNNSKFIFLGVYSKSSINEEASYKLTYPVSDPTGIRVVKDSGTVHSTLHWKLYEPTTPAKFRKQVEERMTKQMESNLLKDVVRKIKQNKDSE